MGLAVTWCDTARRLMGQAALHQRGPNEVRHRFSPRDHDNVKVPEHAICEKDAWQDISRSADGVCRLARHQALPNNTLDDFVEISHQYHQSTLC